MKRAAFALVAALALLLVAWPVQAQDYQFFGTYSIQGDRYDGTFLAFTVTTEGLSDLAVQDATLVADVPLDLADANRSDATVTAMGPNATVALHDTPTAFVKVTATSAIDLSLTLDPDANLRTEEGRVVVSRAGVEAAAWSPDGEVTLSNGTVTASLEAGDDLMFRVRPGGMKFMSAYEPAISTGVESGAVGAEAFVQGGPSNRAGHAVATYSDLSVDVDRGQALELTVSSDDPLGKVVVVRADDLALPGRGQVQVTYDGHNLSRADSIQDVLDPHDDGLDAEFFTAQVDSGNVVLVSVPHFSVHEITIQRVVEFVRDNPEVAAVTVGAGLAVLAVAAFGMYKPRKGS